MRKVGTLIVALVIAVTLGIGSRAEAGTIQLGFILDGSGSIGSANWNIIRSGLATAVNTYIPVGGPDTYEISVVQFGNIAATNITRVMVTDATVRSNLAASIAAIPYQNGGATNYALAFTQMLNTLSPTISTAASSYVNFATDGQQNTGGTGVTERNALIAAGVDNISIEGIGGAIDAIDLQLNFCYPGPCDTTAPYNFPTRGFYLGVADAQGYADAIGNKIQTVVTAPDPGSTLLLLGMGLVGLRAWRKRRQ